MAGLISFKFEITGRQMRKLPRVPTSIPRSTVCRLIENSIGKGRSDFVTSPSPGTRISDKNSCKK